MIKKAIFSVLILAFLFLFFYNFFTPSEMKLAKGTVVDSLCVIKSKRELQVFSEKKLIKTYNISLGTNPVGDKEFEGDKKTPEGHYFINDKNANSHFYRNLGISYPNENDIATATFLGKNAGKDIKIHGLGTLRAPFGKLHLWMDWTSGCVAVTNAEIDELFDVVEVGTPILILP